MDDNKFFEWFGFYLLFVFALLVAFVAVGRRHGIFDVPERAAVTCAR